MALIECPECQKQISTTAKSCPSCGYVIATQTDVKGVEPLLIVRPSWWSCFWLLFFSWLIVPLIIAICRRRSLVMKIYPNRVSLERGLMSKEFRDLFIKDIRSIDVDQSFFQRMLGIGQVTISTAAGVDPDEEIPGVANPTRIKELLIQLREKE